MTAHLQCFDDDRHRRDDDSLWHLFAQGGDTCMVEHSERQPMPTQPAQASTRIIERDGEQRLRVSLNAPMAQLTLLAAPTRDRDHVVMLVRPLHAQPQHCEQAALWIDGESIPIAGLREVRNQRGHEVQFAIRRQALTHVATALRVALTVCGHEAELDSDSKTTLALFEIRFREQLAHID